MRARDRWNGALAELPESTVASGRVRAFIMTIQGNAKRFRCVEDVRRLRVALSRAVQATHVRVVVGVPWRFKKAALYTGRRLI